MSSKQEAQEKMMQFQLLEQTLQSIKQRQQAVLQSLEELSRSKQAMEDLKDEKPCDALIPIGSNNFISGSIKDSKDIFVGIGSGVVVKKTREHALEIIDSHIDEIKKAMDELIGHEQRVIMQLEKLKPEIQKLVNSVKLED